MKKNRFVIAVLLCTMVISTAYSEDITDFDALKKAIQKEDQNPVDIEELQSNIQFSETLDINKKVTISGKEGENTASFNPNGYTGEKDPTFTKNAFSVESGGDLTLEHLTVTGFGTKKLESSDSVESSIVESLSTPQQKLYSSVVDVSKGGKLTIGPGVTFSENVTSSSYVFGGTIVTEGEVTLESSSSGDVLFEAIERKTTEENGRVPRDDQFDIEMRKGSKLTITGEDGKVTFENGIVSNPMGDGDEASITHSGENEVVFSGLNGRYTGKFVNEKGTVTVAKDAKSFLGGTSTFKNGTLNWYAGSNASHGGIDLHGTTKLVVGEASSPSGASLTLDGSKGDEFTAVDGNGVKVGITINEGAELTIQNFNAQNNKVKTFSQKISGEGNLNLTNDNITFDGSGDDSGISNTLTLSTSNSQLTLSNFESDNETLSAIVGGTNSNLDLTLNNYTGTFTPNPMTVDGSTIKTLTFTGETNSITGDLTISGTGKATNSTNVETTIAGDVTIENGSDGIDNLTNESGATLTIEKGSGTKGFTNKGKVSNSGIINLGEGVNGTNSENGSITGSGDLIVDGTFSNEDNAAINISGTLDVGSLTNKNKITITGSGKLTVDGDLHNESGNIDLSGSTGDFTVGGTVQNSVGSIKGINATFGSYNDSTGEGTTLELSGKLTINGTGGSANELQNSGKVQADSIEVKNGGITNSGGTITTTSGDITLTNGGITNNGGTISSKGKIDASNGVINNGENSNITAEGDITASSITNSGSVDEGQGATVKSTNGSITVSGNVSNVGSADKIVGQSLTLGSVTQNEGTIQSTSGDITVKGAVTNSNTGSITSAGKLTVTGALTNTGNVTMNGGSLANVTNNNNGIITNQSGDLTITGTVTGGDAGGSQNPVIKNEGGSVTVSGNASGYKGKYEQSGGTTTVSSANGLFGGEKDIKGGKLSAAGDNTEMYKGKVKLSSGAEFDFKYTGDNGAITKDILEFTNGGSANFIGSGTYTLSSDITGASGGSVTFQGTNVKLADGNSDTFDFKSFTLDNSTLKLAESKVDDGELDNFTLKNFHASNNSSVDLNLRMTNQETDEFGVQKLESDRLKFTGDSDGTLRVGKVYISTGSSGSNFENGYDFKTTDEVITNEGQSNVKFDTEHKPEKDDIIIGSNIYTYDLEVEDNTLGLTVTGVADENTLYEVNKKDGDRKFFIDTTKDNGVYNIGKSLDDSGAKTGKDYFDVYGTSGNRDEATLSGKIKKNGAVTEEKGSLFEIQSSDENSTKLSISDLTISDADSSTRGGSVVSNSDADSKVTLDNVAVKNNSSSASNAKGGAIYNNGGQGTDPQSSSAPGLVLKNVYFEGNSAGTDGKGGAVYNDSLGYALFENVTTAEGTDEAKNDIYNSGHLLTQGTNVFNSLYTNGAGGTSTFTDTNTFSELVNETGATDMTFATGSNNTITEKFENGGNAKNQGNLTIGESAAVTGSNGSITNNSGNLTLNGDASGYTGSFSQSKGETTVVGTNSKFFGGSSTVSGGTLNWLTKNDLGNGANLTLSGKETIFNIGDGNGNNGTVTFKSGSSISQEVETNIYSNGKLIVDGADSVNLNNKGQHVWQGEVELKSGTLNLNGTNNYYSDDLIGKLNATGGNLNIKDNGEDGTQLVLDNGSSVAKDVVTSIEKNSKVVLRQGEFTLDNQDTWKGSVILEETSKGTLTFDGYTKEDMGTLKAFGGSVDIKNSSEITFKGTDDQISGIGKAVKTTIDGNSKVTLEENGYLYLDDDENTKDTWQGTVVLDGGTLDYEIKAPEDMGTLDADKGNLNLLSGSVLKIKEPSAVEDAVAVDIRSGSTVDIGKGAKFNIDSETGDKWSGLVKLGGEDGEEVTGGEFQTKGLDNSATGGQLQQTSGSSTFTENSNIYISGSDSFISGGDVSVTENSRLTFGSGSDINLENLTVSGDSLFSILNSQVQNVTAETKNVDGNSNYALDLNLRNGPSDKFIFDKIEAENGGNINVADFGFVGGAPVYRNVELQLFEAKDEIPENVTFSATDKKIMTPIGEYGLKSLGGGKYLASLGRYNPKVFRGQAATLAMYNNQLAVNDILLNHVILHSEKSQFGQGRTANKYAAVNPLFAPYQYTKKEGGLWYKTYVDIEKLSMTQNLNVNNTAYGSIIGADLPLVNLENGWDFIPTFYVAYNGSNQSYNGVDMYQNGGQGGFMGTFMKNDFIGSVLAYGGGYFNEMNVEGFTDKTGNWFAGTAAKAAYNFHPTQHFTVQPTALISYNAFGKQNWGTDFGVMSMNAGMLNGINVAPGLNLIYARDTWSLYATFQYMYNINDHVGGHAGVDVNLPNLSMRHGYFQYGIGATKTWKDRLNSYFQFVIRNGGRTGVGFQLGIEYLFDWNSLAHDNNSVKPSKKTVIKDKNVVPASSKTCKPNKVNQKPAKSENKVNKVNKPVNETELNKVKVKPAKSENKINTKVNSKNNNTKPAVNKVKTNKPVKVKHTVEINTESDNVIIISPQGVKKTVIKQPKK